MSSETLSACQRSGRIINAQGQELDPVDVISRACREYGAGRVMRAMLSADGMNPRKCARIGGMIEVAIADIIDDIELEMRE